MSVIKTVASSRSRQRSRVMTSVIQTFWESKTTEERSQIMKARARKAWETRRSKGSDGMKVRKWIVKAVPAIDEVEELYHQLYEKRFRRKVRGASLKKSIRGNLEALIRLEGRDGAKKAVTAVLTSPKLKWVTGRPDQFLANQDNLDSYVAGAMEEARPAGEQSEWGDRGEAGSRSLSADEFFGR